MNVILLFSFSKIIPYSIFPSFISCFISSIFFSSVIIFCFDSSSFILFSSMLFLSIKIISFSVLNFFIMFGILNPITIIDNIIIVDIINDFLFIISSAVNFITVSVSRIFTTYFLYKYVI